MVEGADVCQTSAGEGMSAWWISMSSSGIMDERSCLSPVILGEFFPCGGLVHLLNPLGDLVAAIEYFFKCSRGHDGSITIRSWREPSERPIVDEDTMVRRALVYGTRSHERSHFLQLVGLPIGLFMFRLLSAKYSIVQHACHRFNRSGTSIVIPMLCWASQKPHDASLRTLALRWLNINESSANGRRQHRHSPSSPLTSPVGILRHSMAPGAV